jgi:site-specific DNA-methyltransferase (adenine-specific)
MIHHADCLDVLPTLDAESIDAIVTDPPYGLEFMGKDWDHGCPGIPFWSAMLRVAKPGAYLLAFGGARTVHRLACAIEDAGWEIRDCLMWVYRQGFPKSRNISKDIDRLRGAKREVIGTIKAPGMAAMNVEQGVHQRTKYEFDVLGDAVTDEAKAWEGWGTALRPAWEPIVMARKPLRASVARTVLQHGTGALNIEGCRIAVEDESRWPANLVLTDPVLDGGADVVGGEPSYSRAFLVSKADRSDREPVLGGAPPGGARDARANTHPTVKPVELMRHLVRLVTPPGGIVLDPFLGSGSTALAAEMEGFRWLGIEREEEFVRIAEARLNGTQRGLGLG